MGYRVLAIGETPSLAFLSWKLSLSQQCHTTMVWSSNGNTNSTKLADSALLFHKFSGSDSKLRSVSRYHPYSFFSTFGSLLASTSSACNKPYDFVILSCSSFKQLTQVCKRLKELSEFENKFIDNNTSIVIDFSDYYVGLEKKVRRYFPENVILSFILETKLRKLSGNVVLQVDDNLTACLTSAFSSPKGVLTDVQMSKSSNFSSLLSFSSFNCKNFDCLPISTPSLPPAVAFMRYQWKRIIPFLTLECCSILFECHSGDSLDNVLLAKPLISGLFHELYQLATLLLGLEQRHHSKANCAPIETLRGPLEESSPQLRDGEKFFDEFDDIKDYIKIELARFNKLSYVVPGKNTQKDLLQSLKARYNVDYIESPVLFYNFYNQFHQQLGLDLLILQPILLAADDLVSIKTPYLESLFTMLTQFSTINQADRSLYLAGGSEGSILFSRVGNPNSKLQLQIQAETLAAKELELKQLEENLKQREDVINQAITNSTSSSFSTYPSSSTSPASSVSSSSSVAGPPIWNSLTHLTKPSSGVVNNLTADVVESTSSVSNGSLPFKPSVSPVNSDQAPPQPGIIKQGFIFPPNSGSPLSSVTSMVSLSHQTPLPDKFDNSRSVNMSSGSFLGVSRGSDGGIRGQSQSQYQSSSSFPQPLNQPPSSRARPGIVGGGIGMNIRNDAFTRSHSYSSLNDGVSNSINGDRDFHSNNNKHNVNNNIPNLTKGKVINPPTGRLNHTGPRMESESASESQGVSSFMGYPSRASSVSGSMSMSSHTLMPNMSNHSSNSLSRETTLSSVVAPIFEHQRTKSREFNNNSTNNYRHVEAPVGNNEIDMMLMTNRRNRRRSSINGTQIQLTNLSTVTNHKDENSNRLRPLRRSQSVISNSYGYTFSPSSETSLDKLSRSNPRADTLTQLVDFSLGFSSVIRSSSGGGGSEDFRTNMGGGGRSLNRSRSGVNMRYSGVSNDLRNGHVSGGNFNGSEGNLSSGQSNRPSMNMHRRVFSTGTGGEVSGPRLSTVGSPR